jgi:hypothetical protein
MTNCQKLTLFPWLEGNLLLSSLLPYDPASKLQNRLIPSLQEYLVLLTATEEAMQSLQEGMLSAFDPLVGENACQIRAVKLALAISHCSFDVERLLNAISNAKNRIEKLLQTDLSHPNFQELITQEGLEIPLLPEEHFLIISYILTKTKVDRTEDLKPLVMNEKTDYKKIKDFGSVGSLFAKLLVNSLRKKLASNSVKFTQSLSEENLDQWIQSHNNLNCLPCFLTTKTVIDHAVKNNIPILLIADQKAKDHDYKTIDQIKLYFKPSDQRYKIVSKEELDLEKPALILHGSTCREKAKLPNRGEWISELSNFCPRDLLLAYAAAHRQYPDESFDILFIREEIEEFEYYRSKAEEWGCSLNNPSLFFLAHAYCDKLKNLIS